MSNIKLTDKKELNKVVNAYKIVSNFSMSELETVEILANHKEDIFKSINESRKNLVSPISSIL